MNIGRLYLNDNQLTGYIPSQLNIPSLKVLKLNNNNLLGPIPTFLCNEQFRILAIQNNNFSCFPRYSLTITSYLHPMILTVISLAASL